MPKLRINKGDFNRVLLTETTPYEVPVTFNNDGFYEHVRSNDENVKNFLDKIRKNNNWKILRLRNWFNKIKNNKSVGNKPK